MSSPAAIAAAVDAYYDNPVVIKPAVVSKPHDYTDAEWNERQVCPKCKNYHVVHRWATDKKLVADYTIEIKFCPECGTRTTRGAS